MVEVVPEHVVLLGGFKQVRILRRPRVLVERVSLLANICALIVLENNLYTSWHVSLLLAESA